MTAVDRPERWSSKVLPDLFAGVYRHYKGHLYHVLGYARDADHCGRTVVVFIGLELDGAKSFERMKVQDVGEFFAPVHPETGVVLNFWDGTFPEPVARYTYVGPNAPLPASED